LRYDLPSEENKEIMHPKYKGDAYAGKRYYPLPQLRHEKSHTETKISGASDVRQLPFTARRPDHPLSEMRDKKPDAGRAPEPETSVRKMQGTADHCKADDKAHRCQR
jgi:hypothetical protein